MTTVYTTHSRYADHEYPDYQHPEHPGRIKAVWQTLRDAHLTDRMQAITPKPIATADLQAVHDQNLLDTLQWIAGQNKLALIDHDTYAKPESYDIARLAAGGVAQAVTAVVQGEAANGLAVVRPPGHHATPDRSMGFCLLSNIAIAARHAQNHHGVNRILIVDYDVHHGNGTQDVFYADDSVLFVSVHQYQPRYFFPGTGGLRETGSGNAQGTTINVPLSGRYGDASYAQIMGQIVQPAAERFQPEIILVSAGFDAHWQDPLATMRLSLTGYAQMTRQLIALAQDLCGGKIVFVMEGGYDLTALGHGVRNIAHALLGDDTISDPYGAAPGNEDDVQPLIDQVRALHQL